MSSQTFSDFHVAAKFRDVMRRLARREIDATLPPDEFGVVTAVNTVDLNASILMTGATESVTIPYTGTAPAVDDEVRVTGRAGSRYISGSGGGGGGEDEDVEGGEIITYDSGTGIANVLLDNGDTVDVTLISTTSNGIAGPAGSTIYNGSGAPSSLLGVPGDYYLDTLPGDLYQKSGSTWTVIMNLTDRETSYVAATAGSTYTANWTTARVHQVTLTVNPTTLSFAGAIAGKACSLTLVLVQDATGNRTITWPGSVKWPGGIAFPASIPANSIDIYVAESYDGGTTWFTNKAGGAYA